MRNQRTTAQLVQREAMGSGSLTEQAGGFFFFFDCHLTVHDSFHLLRAVKRKKAAASAHLSSNKCVKKATALKIPRKCGRPVKFYWPPNPANFPKQNKMSLKQTLETTFHPSGTPNWITLLLYTIWNHLSTVFLKKLQVFLFSFFRPANAAAAG